MKAVLTKHPCRIWFIENEERKEGAHPNIRGDVSGISGNIDDCEISESDRITGIDINELVIENK